MSIRRSESGDAPQDVSFQALGSLMRRYRWRFVAVNLTRVAASMFVVVHPYFLAEFATSIQDHQRAFRFLIALLLSGLAHALLWTACDFANARWINPLSFEYKRIAFEAFWENEYSTFTDHPSGKVGSYINDLQRHSLALWDSLHYGFVPMVTSLPIYFVLFIRASWQTSVVYAAFLVVSAVAMTAISRPVKSTQHHLTDTVATNNGRVFDSYSNFVNVFSFGAQPKEIARHRDDTVRMSAAEVRSSTALSAYWGTASLLVRGLLWTFIILFNWYLFDTGQISFVALVVAVTVMLDFTQQFFNVVHNLGIWVDSAAAYRAAYNYLFPARNIVEEPGSALAASRATDQLEVRHGLAEEDPVPAVALELKGINFAYPDRPEIRVLTDINLRIRPGEKLGIVGRSGEGKSTLVKLLLGFYQPTSGQMLVAGHPVDREVLHRITAYVPQDTSLFQETISYNIAYASERSLSDDEVRHAAKRAHIDDFIQTLGEGYQTLVGERGIKLSLGQRQRIALARAFVKASPLLILDEATSALDSHTEALIQDSLDGLNEETTAIVIAHRLATLNSMDRIIVVDDGRIIEQGTKSELLARGGLFADLWATQHQAEQSP